MTVRELILALSKFPEKSQVIIYVDEFFEIDTIEIAENKDVIIWTE